jgi:hypothetical protein
VDFKEMSCEGMVWCGSRYRQVAGTCEHNIEPSASTKCGEFIYKLENYYLLKKDSTPWN